MLRNQAEARDPGHQLRARQEMAGIMLTFLVEEDKGIRAKETQKGRWPI